ncbi:class I SAM-dependent methyltransferase [Olleya sp. YSTF-M6]|uniref:Class I SAM-dependent methyltransferase n=1 Tax=Olleya sediminilitoris TaxID=2795739 RepID=A0ABS1WJV4_9FLAO|nr:MULTISPECIES: class I SAM-dependent methyltransferase [Olleya]MBL7559386.1 class I SAM-dependent methyltransferase [Olleya sediminilitoris]
MINNFDVAAKTYDFDFTLSKIGQAQRNVVYRNLSAVFKPKKALNILELNCGTGFDALNFAKSGHIVTATDISKQMIAVAQSKKNEHNVKFATQDITRITTASFKTKFDYIFSNFGGFNCLTTSQIETFFKTSAKLLKPKSKITLVIMPKYCIWEFLYFGLKFQLKKAKRRQTKSYAIANVNGTEVKTWYYNPKQIEALAQKQFKINTVKPVGLSIPPSYLEHSIASKPFLLSIFKALDAIFTASFLSKFADHYLIELELK